MNYQTLSRIAAYNHEMAILDQQSIFMYNPGDLCLDILKGAQAFVVKWRGHPRIEGESDLFRMENEPLPEYIIYKHGGNPSHWNALGEHMLLPLGCDRFLTEDEEDWATAILSSAIEKRRTDQINRAIACLLQLYPRQRVQILDKLEESDRFKIQAELLFRR